MRRIKKIHNHLQVLRITTIYKARSIFLLKEAIIHKKSRLRFKVFATPSRYASSDRIRSRRPPSSSTRSYSPLYPCGSIDNMSFLDSRAIALLSRCPIVGSKRDKRKELSSTLRHLCPPPVALLSCSSANLITRRYTFSKIFILLLLLQASPKK